MIFVSEQNQFLVGQGTLRPLPQIAGQRGPMNAHIFLQQRTLHLPGAVEHWAAVPATLLEHRCNLRAPLRDLFLFGGGVVGSFSTVSPLVPSAIPWEMVKERRTPDGVIPMRSAIQVTVIPDRCMPWMTPLEYSVSFPPRFTHGSMGCRTCFLPIFCEAFFPEFFPLCTSPSRELKSNGMESPAPKIPKNNVFFAAVQDIHLLLCVLSRLHGGLCTL